MGFYQSGDQFRQRSLAASVGAGDNGHLPVRNLQTDISQYFFTVSRCPADVLKCKHSVSSFYALLSYPVPDIRLGNTASGFLEYQLRALGADFGIRRTDSVIKVFPPMILFSPITVSPPRTDELE